MEQETTPQETPVEAEATAEVVSNEIPNEEVQEVPQETVETPVVPQEPEYEEEEVVIPQPEAPKFDLSQIAVDESGNMDAQAFAQYMASWQQGIENQARETARAEFASFKQEDALWKKATKEYPELESNKELRDLVQQQRYGAIVQGKALTPKQAADRIFQHIKTAKTEAAKAATTSVQIQESAHLETSSNTSTADADRKGELMGKISSRNEREASEARQALIKDMLASGKL